MQSLVTKPINVVPQAKCAICEGRGTILVKTDRGMRPVSCPQCGGNRTQLVTK